jgi:hypothetical protein
MIYFSSVPVVPESVDQRQYRALLRFQEECRKRGLVETYSSISEFREKLTRHLAQTVIRSFSTKKNGRANSDVAVVPDRPQLPPLAEEARHLLLEASHDLGGTILRVRTTAGLTIQTNGRNLLEDRGPRAEARWEGALRQLRDLGLIQDRGGRGEVFAVTHDGYRVADQLSEESRSVPVAV